MRIEPLRGSVPRAPLPLRPTGTSLPRVLGTPTGLCPTFGAGAIAVVTRGGEVLDSKTSKPRRALGQFCRRRISQRTTEIGSTRRRARLFLPLLRLYGRNLPLLGHTANGARPDLGSPLLFSDGAINYLKALRRMDKSPLRKTLFVWLRLPPPRPNSFTENNIHGIAGRKSKIPWWKVFPARGCLGCRSPLTFQRVEDQMSHTIPIKDYQTNTFF